MASSAAPKGQASKEDRAGEVLGRPFSEPPTPPRDVLMHWGRGGGCVT